MTRASLRWRDRGGVESLRAVACFVAVAGERQRGALAATTRIHNTPQAGASQLQLVNRERSAAVSVGGSTIAVMPELDYMIIAEYARIDGGLLHLLGGGVDTLTTPAVPVMRNLGIALRMLLTRAECGRQHELEIIFQGEDGQRLSDIRGSFSATYPQGGSLPAGWKAAAAFCANIPVPIPQYGVYSFELLISGSHMKTIPFRVIAPPTAALNG